MTDEIGNMILERLRRMDDRLVNIESDISDLKTRAAAIEEHVGGLYIGITGVNNRLDRLTERVDRIERRLGLSEGH